MFPVSQKEARLREVSKWLSWESKMPTDTNTNNLDQCDQTAEGKHFPPNQAFHLLSAANGAHINQKLKRYHYPLISSFKKETARIHSYPNDLFSTQLTQSI